MAPALVLTLRLILLHSIEGHEVMIAPEQVTSLRATRPSKPNAMFTENANCLIGLTDGRFITVVETCRNVRELLEENP